MKQEMTWYRLISRYCHFCCVLQVFSGQATSPLFMPCLWTVIPGLAIARARASWDHLHCHAGHPGPSQYPGFSQRQSDPGSRILDPGSWIQDPGSWIQDPGSWILVPGSRILDPESRILGAGSRILDSGSSNVNGT